MNMEKTCKIAISFIGRKKDFLTPRLTRDFFLLEGFSPRARKFRESVEVSESLFRLWKIQFSFFFILVHIWRPGRIFQIQDFLSLGRESGKLYPAFGKKCPAFKKNVIKVQILGNFITCGRERRNTVTDFHYKAVKNFQEKKEKEFEISSHRKYVTLCVK